MTQKKKIFHVFVVLGFSLGCTQAQANFFKKILDFLGSSKKPATLSSSHPCQGYFDSSRSLQDYFKEIVDLAVKSGDGSNNEGCLASIVIDKFPYADGFTHEMALLAMLQYREEQGVKGALSELNRHPNAAVWFRSAEVELQRLHRMASESSTSLGSSGSPKESDRRRKLSTGGGTSPLVTSPRDTSKGSGMRAF